MRHSRTSDFKVGDKCFTKWGDLVTVARVTERMIEIVEDLDSDRKLYIPAHGEIERIDPIGNMELVETGETVTVYADKDGLLTV